MFNPEDVMTSNSFANDFLWCPTCPPEMVGKRKDRKSAATMLEVVTRNYSGCSVDIAQCPKCQGRFQVSYRVDAVTPLAYVRADGKLEVP